MPNFRVNSILGGNFRRNGITFTGAPTEIDTETVEWIDAQGQKQVGWSPDKVANLISAHGSKDDGAALHVEPLDAAAKALMPPKAGTPAEAVAAANAAGVSLPGHPTQAEADRTPPTRGRGR